MFSYLFRVIMMSILTTNAKFFMIISVYHEISGHLYFEYFAVLLLYKVIVICVSISRMFPFFKCLFYAKIIPSHLAISLYNSV